MASALLAFELQVKNLNQLQKLEARVTALERSSQDLTARLRESTKGVSLFGAASRNAAGGVNTLAGSLGQIAAFTGISLGLGSIFEGLEKADKASAALRTLGADSNELNAELNVLRKTLGNTASGLELQQGAFQVLQAGYKETSDVVQILDAAVKSANAKLISSEVTVGALTSVLRAYGKGAGEAGDLSEKFFATIASGNLTLEDYAASIGRIAPFAAGAGVGIEQVNAAIAVLTQQGVQASEAVTGLRGVIASIVAPSEQAKKLALDLGLSFNEQALQSKGLAGVLQEVVEKTGGSTEQLTTLLGRIDAVNAALGLSKGEFGDYTTALEAQANAAGKVDKANEEMNNTIIGSAGGVANAFSALTQAVVTDSAPAIIASFNAISGIIESLNSPVGKAIIQFGLMTAAVYALNKAILVLKATKLVGWFAPIIAQLLRGNFAFAAFTLKVKGATLALKAMAVVKTLVNPLALLAAGVVAVGAGAVIATKNIQELNDAAEGNLDTFEDLDPALKKFQAELVKAEASLKRGGREAVAARKKVEKLKQAIDNLQGEKIIRIRIQEIRERFGIDPNESGVRNGRTRGRQGSIDAARKAKEAEERAKAALVAPVAPAAGSASAGAAPPDDTKRATEMLRKQEQRLALFRQEEGLSRDLLALDQQRQDELNEINSLVGVNADLLDELIFNANSVGTTERLEAIEAFGKNALTAAQDLIDATDEQIAADKRRLELIEQGINPSLASELVQIEQQFDATEKLLEVEKLSLETALLGEDAASAEAALIQKQIDLINQKKTALGNSENAAKANAAVEDPEPGKIQAYMDQLKEELADTEGMIVSLAQTITGEIGKAMSSAITGLIDGTKTAQEAFADMFKNIGKAFIDMATQMIAKALVMKALGILFPGSSPASPIPLNIGGAEAIGRASFAGGGYTGDAPRTGGVDGKGGFPAILHPQETVIDHTRPNSALNGQILDIEKIARQLETPTLERSFAGGGYTGNAPRVGGLDGQGGFPAMLHPQETVVDHYGSMGRHSNRSEGSSVDHRQAMRRYPSNGNQTPTFKLETTVINGVEYATVDQVRAMGKQAAKDGATGGYTRSMSTLKNSRSQRSKLGMR